MSRKNWNLQCQSKMIWFSKCRRKLKFWSSTLRRYTMFKKNRGKKYCSLRELEKIGSTVGRKVDSIRRIWRIILLKSHTMRNIWVHLKKMLERKNLSRRILWGERQSVQKATKVCHTVKVINRALTKLNSIRYILRKEQKLTRCWNQDKPTIPHPIWVSTMKVRIKEACNHRNALN